MSPVHRFTNKRCPIFSTPQSFSAREGCPIFLLKFLSCYRCITIAQTHRLCCRLVNKRKKNPLVSPLERTYSMSKVKILLVGAVGDNASILREKLAALNSSKAGPFDGCFCVGPMNLELEGAGDAFPIPVYLQDIDGAGASSVAMTECDDQGIVSLGGTASNLYYLKGGVKGMKGIGVQTFEIRLGGGNPLLVGLCRRHFRASMEQMQHEQCDLFLSSDWPQGMEDVLNVDTEPLSYDVSEAALACRPRYHVCPSTTLFHASPPYRFPNSEHVGRFLAMGPVSKEKKTPKTQKFVHALGLVPLRSHPEPTTAPSTLPCPFGSTMEYKNSQSSVAVPKFAMKGNVYDAAYSRFGNAANKKRGRDANSNADSNFSLEAPDDPAISTLFLYGLHKDVTGELQSTRSPKVLTSFAKYGVTKVRHPPNVPTSTYCFLEFPSQKEAHQCLLDCHGRITIDSVNLTLKWATKAAPKQQFTNDTNKRLRKDDHFVTQAESKDSTTLFFHPPKNTKLCCVKEVKKMESGASEKMEADGKAPNASSAEKMDQGDGTDAIQTDVATNERDTGDEKDVQKSANEDSNKAPQTGFATSLQQYVQKVLEDALNDGVQNGEERVTAESEPALRVEVRCKDQYGFLEFASHAAATMALAAITNSTDGGLLNEGENMPLDLAGTTLRWAKGSSNKTASNTKGGSRDHVLEALGMKRQFYPADGRRDCWFCLSSPTCETHLITGVYNDWYATMPKGPVHQGHILLVPVTHTREGAWTLSNDAEWIKLVEKVQEHASQTYDMDLFVFERAMETKGGYHTHIQCVPIPRDSSTRLQTTMQAHAKACGFDLRQIQSDLGVKAMLEKKDSYFYAEIRTRSHQHRFLYKRAHESQGSDVPLQFAREVLASVLNNSKLAHWKACVVDKEQETELASDFRASFSAIP